MWAVLSQTKAKCLPHRQTHGGNVGPPDPSGTSQPPYCPRTGCTPSAAGSPDRTEERTLFINQNYVLNKKAISRYCKEFLDFIL